MALPQGTRLSSYEVVDLLGAGGMGEVYRARDTKLERHVAIKLVLETFVADADRAMRFEREAKTLAALNHPNIATLFGLESSEGRHFLVMELVEGDSLAQRITSRPGGMRVEDAIEIGRQIAEALEAAHEKGIIHRDLKPANVKLTADDKVKVLDFGLAKALGDSAGAGVGPGAPGASLMNSPTFTSPAMTQMGVILGTASYMSPEQARGYAADHRADIFSFGVVLYEMLTGRAPFAGETVSDVLAAVLARDPDLAALPADLSPRLVELVKRCLDKNPKKRWQAIGDVRYELEAILVSPRALPAAPAVIARRPRWQTAAMFGAVALASAALVGIPMWKRTPAPSADVTKFGIHLPVEQTIFGSGRSALAISPSGSHVAFIANRRLFVRPMNELEPRLVVANENRASISSPVFSPDGSAIVFCLDDAIQRVSLAGGPPIVLTRVAGGAALSWFGDHIYYGGADGIYRLPVNGGNPEPVIELIPGERVSHPHLLRDGQTLVFALIPGRPEEQRDAVVVAQRMGTKERTEILHNAVEPYVADGYLLFVRGGLLFAMRFDETTLKASGAPLVGVEGVRRGAGVLSAAVAQYSIATDGSLVYVPGPKDLTGYRQLSVAFVDHAGGVQKLKIPAGSYNEIRLSRDGRKVAFAATEAQEASIWIYDTQGAASPRRLTFGGKDRFPVWSPDGQTVAFQSDRDGAIGIYSQPADGSGVARRLTSPAAGVAHIPNDWSPDGNTLLFDEQRSGGVTLMAWDRRTGTVSPFGGVTSTAKTAATFAPDGRWVAYNTVPSGRSYNMVYVQPWPATGALFEVSKRTEDGHHATWARDGKAIFYTPGPGALMVKVPVSTIGAFTAGEPVLVARPFNNQPTSTYRPFDTTPDGRFIATLSAEVTEKTTAGGDIIVVRNWLAELSTRAPR